MYNKINKCLTHRLMNRHLINKSCFTALCSRCTPSRFRCATSRWWAFAQTLTGIKNATIHCTAHFSTKIVPEGKMKARKCPFYRLLRAFENYSNSIVPGGFPVQSYTTRLTCFTSLTILVVTVCRTSHGSCAASAVIKSLVRTARRATA